LKNESIDKLCAVGTYPAETEARLGRLERDEIDSPRMATIRNLAEALGVDPAELVE
jgi:transcriptional regulator with XRE-family HTH domain